MDFGRDSCYNHDAGGGNLYAFLAEHSPHCAHIRSGMGIDPGGYAAAFDCAGGL